jgi:hypothetical protein
MTTLLQECNAELTPESKRYVLLAAKFAIKSCVVQIRRLRSCVTRLARGVEAKHAVLCGLAWVRSTLLPQ